MSIVNPTKKELVKFLRSYIAENQGKWDRHAPIRKKINKIIEFGHITEDEAVLAFSPQYIKMMLKWLTLYLAQDVVSLLETDLEIGDTKWSEQSGMKNRD